MSATMTQAEFARHLGKQRSYVTELKGKGRLVTDSKGRVKVEETEQLISATQDPGKQGVADYHQTQREQRNDADELTSKVGSAYQQARAMKEKYAAMQAKMSYEQAIGELVSVSEAKLAVMDGDTIIRNRLEAMPDILAPQLAAESDEQKIRSILIDQIEYLLNDLSQTFRKISHG